MNKQCGMNGIRMTESMREMNENENDSEMSDQ